MRQVRATRDQTMPHKKAIHWLVLNKILSLVLNKILWLVLSKTLTLRLNKIRRKALLKTQRLVCNGDKQVNLQICFLAYLVISLIALDSQSLNLSLIHLLLKSN